MKPINLLSSLTRFELWLWVISMCSIAGSFLMSGGDTLTVIASLIGVTALIFVAKGYVIGQILTVVFAVIYGIISLRVSYYGEMITYLGMTAPIAIVTVIEWLRHPYDGTKEVEVSKLSRTKIIVMVVASAVVTAVFYFILRALGNASLVFSTLSVTTSFIASYFTYCRSPYYAIGYAANDLVLIVLWIIAAAEDRSCMPMVVCFAMFFVNDMYGFFNWRRMQNRQAQRR